MEIESLIDVSVVDKLPTKNITRARTLRTHAHSLETSSHTQETDNGEHMKLLCTGASEPEGLEGLNPN